MKNNIHGFTDNKLIVCEAMCTDLIQTLPRRLCVGTLGRVSFLDLFGPIAGG